MKKVDYFIVLIVVSIILITPNSMSYSANAETVDIDRIEKTAIIQFGHYEQNNYNDETEPIEWVVLEKSDKTIKMISKKILEFMPFHKKGNLDNWEKSSIRAWLNKDFYNKAFSKKEKQIIVKGSHENSYYESKGIVYTRRNTQENVYLLSKEEIRQYFMGLVPKYSIRQYADAKASRYAVCNCFGEDMYMPNTKDHHLWWTRTGFNGGAAYCWENGGSVSSRKSENDFVGVRPVIEINSAKAGSCIKVISYSYQSSQVSDDSED